MKKLLIVLMLSSFTMPFMCFAAVPGRVTVNGTQFDVCGQRIWMNGANTPWDNWNDFGGSYDAAWWDGHYALFNTNGLNSSRVWITCSGEVGINIDTAGYVSGATAAHWANLDDFFAKAQNRGVYIKATLMSFDHFKDSYTTYTRWRNWINSDTNIDSYINNYLVPFLTRYGGNPALWCIDMCNEPDWATDTEGGTISWTRFQRFWARAANVIHENSQVLVTVGIGVIKYNSDNAGMNGNKVSDAALQAQLNDPHAKLDFYSPHWYAWMDPYWTTLMWATPASFGISAKPCVVGECSANGSTGHTLTQDYEAAYSNGWQGMMPWTSNGVDTNGGWAQVQPAANSFKNNHNALVLPVCSGSTATFTGTRTRTPVITPTFTLTATRTYTRTVTLTSTRTATASSTRTSTFNPSPSFTRTTIPASPTPTITQTIIYTPSCPLIWSDEFSGAIIDTNKWVYETGAGGWGNNELEYYTSRTDNARVENGMLVIEAKQELYSGSNYTSARIKTQTKFSHAYGRVEARIKLPYGQGIWPAFWMLGQDIPTVGWPACGEIDIMEMIGGGEDRDDTTYGTAHWDSGGHASYGGRRELADPQWFYEDYHIFGIEWDAAAIRWYLDGVQYHVIDITPAELSELRQEYFIILNLAVGGNWPGSPDGTTVFPQKMYVDWVRWYDCAAPTASATASVSPSSTYTRTRTVTRTNTQNPTYTMTRTPTRTITATNTANNTFTVTGTRTISPSATFTATRTMTLTHTPNPFTPTATFTDTPVISPTHTGSRTATATAANSHTGTATVSASPSRTFTGTLTRTATYTVTQTHTQNPFTPTLTNTNTVALSPTYTGTRTATASGTPTITPSFTRTATSTSSVLPTSSVSPTAIITNTPTSSVSGTVTVTRTCTATASPTITATYTATQTASRTQTSVPFTQTPTLTATPRGEAAIISVDVFPNPYRPGQGMNFRVRVEGSPSEFTINIYTAAFRKVMTHSWTTGLSYPESDIAIGDWRVSFLAGGVYYYTLSMTDSRGGAKVRSKNGIMLIIK